MKIVEKCFAYITDILYNNVERNTKTILMNSLCAQYAQMGADMEFIERKRWLFFGLPFTFTKYTLKEDMITIKTGLFKTVENDCYMYKVQDVEHTATMAEKLFKLGTIMCYTGDSTHPKLAIEHVRNSKAIKEFILRESEEARLKRRTVNMLDIGSGDLSDMDNF